MTRRFTSDDPDWEYVSDNLIRLPEPEPAEEEGPRLLGDPVPPPN